MIIKFFLNLALVFLIFIVDLSFFKSFFTYFGNINLLLIVLIFSVALFDYKQSVLWIISIFILNEVYGFYPFFYSTFLFSGVVFFIYFLFFHVFTDRSFYSFLIITILSTLFYEFFQRLLIFFWQGNSFFFVKEFWFISINAILANVVVVFFAFYLFNFLSDKFNSIFISKGPVV